MMTGSMRRMTVAMLSSLAVSLTTSAARAQGEDYDLLQATQTVFRSLSERLRPSLVRIETVGGTQPTVPLVVDDGDSETPRGPQQFVDSPGSNFVVADGPTTGLVYSSDGYIVSSSYNFARQPALISVVLSDGRRLAADLIARDQVRKIALLHVDAKDLVVPEWVSQFDVEVGQWAVALGLGFGGQRPSVSVGIISAKNRMVGNAIQTDAKLSPVNYGGPLVDIDGRVIGISVPMAQRPGELAGVEMYDSGVGFVVPKRRVDAIVAELKKGKDIYRGWLGMQLGGQAEDGVYVGRIADPSPLREAGVIPGDKLWAAEGRPIHHFGQLVQTLYMIPAGTKVHLCMEREGEPYEVDVVLARNTDLGPLPDYEEPFDPSLPLPGTEDEGDGGD